MGWAPPFGFGLTLIQLVMQFRAQFDEFNSVPDGDVAITIVNAASFVDPLVWAQADYAMALLNLAAHFMSLKQMQLASIAQGGTGETDIFVRSISIGERRVQFGQRQGEKGVEATAGPGESLLSQTIYGQTYLMLRSRNITAVAVV